MTCVQSSDGFKYQKQQSILEELVDFVKDENQENVYFYSLARTQKGKKNNKEIKQKDDKLLITAPFAHFSVLN